MRQAFKLHDKVSWNSPQGPTHGQVVRIITQHLDLDGHTVAATPDDPHYEVQSDKSGRHAVHRGEALRPYKD
ncbi:MAG: DUF2945 domain-containing protein [Janthinobacterium lividum]